MNRSLNKQGISLQHATYLLLLANNGSLRIKELNALSDNDAALTTRVIKLLREKKLVEQTSDSIRKYKIFLTDKGKDVVRFIGEVFAKLRNELAETSQDEKQEALLSAILSKSRDKTMELILDNVLKIYFLICLLLLILYIPRMWYFLAAFRKHPRLQNIIKNRIAILVPAKNESKTIHSLFDSLNKQTYDRSMFDVHVIVEDPIDPTIAIAKKMVNATVHVVLDQTRKGEALDGALKTILKETPNKYNAFIIIDADNLAHPDFILEMNNALASGRQIIVGKKYIKNWESIDRKSRSLVSNCTSLVYTMVDDLGNSHRNLHDIPVSMCGTGMMIRDDVIKDLRGWPYRTLTEDFEVMVDCLLKGYTSLYYKHAIVYTEEAVEHRVSF